MRSLLVLPLFFFVALAQAATEAPVAATASESPASAPAVSAALPAASLPALYIVGDSTAANSTKPNIQGWGTPFLQYFDPAKINVVNAALGGRSTRTFITEGHLDALLAKLKPGDTVLIQWGHNDSYELNDANGRGTLHGTGEETEEIIRSTTGQPETLHTFGWYMRKYVNDIRAKGAIPIILTLTIRDHWNADGTIERLPLPNVNLDNANRFHEPPIYSIWSAEVAKALNVPLIDVHNMIADRYEKEGKDIVSTYFNDAKDPTHRNERGAEVDAGITLAGLKALKGPAFDDYLSASGKAVAAAAADAKYILPNVATAALAPATAPAPAPSTAATPAASTPPAAPAPAAAAPATPTLHPALFLVSDSLMKTGTPPGDVGAWGMGYEIIPLFDAAKIHVYNEGAGGRSSRGYIEEGLWAKILARLQAGDFILLMFGHNDAANSANYPDRTTLPGNGDETKKMDSPATPGKKETIHTYGWYLRQYVSDAKAKGATLIICSPVPRDTWTDGKIKRGFDGYAQWAADAAKAAGAPFIDLNTLAANRYDALGQTTVAKYFADNQHTTKGGAQLNAQSVLEGLKQLKDLPLLNDLAPTAAAAPSAPASSSAAAPGAPTKP